MRQYSVDLQEGGESKNLVVPVGTAFPANATKGELFFRTDEQLFYVCTDESGPVWLRKAEIFSVADIAARDALISVESDMALVADSDGLGNPSTFVYDGTTWAELQTTHDGGTYGGV